MNKLSPLAALALASLTLGAQELTAPTTSGIYAIETCDSQGCTLGTRQVPDHTEDPDAISVNRAENGTFDTVWGLRAWSPWPLNTGTGSAAWDPADAAGSGTSGSMILTNTGGNPDPSPTAYSRYGMGQCVRPGRPIVTDPLTCYTAALKVNIAPGQVPGLNQWEGVLWMSSTFYTSEDCSGTPLPTSAIGIFITAGGSNGWYYSGSGGACNNNPAVRSAFFYANIQKQNSVPNPITVRIDDLDFRGKYSFVKGDMDEDGETDLLLHNNVTGQNVAWMMRDEVRQGTGGVAISPTPATLDWQIAGTDDFNADGRNDLVMWNSVTAAAEFWLMNGTSRIGSAVPVAAAMPLPWKPSATADFNHDGKPDIVWRNYSTQKISIWTMNGTTQLGTITPTPDQAVDGNWEIVGAPDVNGDGNPDFLWYNWSSGRIVYWLMDASVVRTYANFTVPNAAGDANWKVLATGDYGIGPANSTGTPIPNTTDIVWRNATSGRMVLWFMDYSGNRTGGVFITPDPPAPATDWTIAGPR